MKPPRSSERPHHNPPERDSWWWGHVPKKPEETEPDEQKNQKHGAGEQTDKGKEQPSHKNKRQPEKEKVASHPPRPEEKQDEKTQHEKRVELVERSLAYKKQFEDKPIPRDPSILARLMVVEHVLALDYQLEHPSDEEDASSPAELLATLGYMGELSEKLENPSIEAAPDIEAAYKSVLQQAEAALEETATVETILAANALVARQSSPAEQDVWLEKLLQEPTGQQNRPNTPQPLAAATLLIASIIHTHKHNRQPNSQPPSATLPYEAPGHDSSDYSKVSQRSFPHSSTLKDRLATDKHSPNFQQPLGTEPSWRPSSPRHESANLPSPYSNAPTEYPRESQSHRPERAFRIPLRPPTAIAAVALASAMRASHPEQSALSSEAPSQELAAALRYSTSTPSNYLEAPHSAPSTSHEPATPQRKLEHMPLHSLLAMAQSIPVGHGNYLRRAFEKGQIDRDGLVKILKSRAKGGDFVTEYRRQAAALQHLRSSPEFLRSAPPASTVQSTLSEESNAPHEHQDAPIPEASSPTTNPSPSVAPKHPATAIWNHTQPPSTSWPLWLIVSLASFGAVVVVILIILL